MAKPVFISQMTPAKREAIRRTMGAREGFVDELSPAEQRELRARNRQVARNNLKRRVKEEASTLGGFVKENGLLLLVAAAAIAGIVVLKQRKAAAASAPPF